MHSQNFQWSCPGLYSFLFSFFWNVKSKFWKLRRTIREIVNKPLCNFFFLQFIPIFTRVHHMCLEKKVFWRQLHLVETYGKIEISALEYCGVPYWVEKIGEWCRFCRLKLQNIGLRGLFSLQFENWMLTNLFLYTWTQCENFIIFLSLRIYVKSILGILAVKILPFQHI